jgi:hypothetical protein
MSRADLIREAYEIADAMASEHGYEARFRPADVEEAVLDFVDDDEDDADELLPYVIGACRARGLMRVPRRGEDLRRDVEDWMVVWRGTPPMHRVEEIAEALAACEVDPEDAEELLPYLADACRARGLLVPPPPAPRPPARRPRPRASYPRRRTRRGPRGHRRVARLAAVASAGHGADDPPSPALASPSASLRRLRGVRWPRAPPLGRRCVRCGP